jgi:hypothetical protein
VTVFGGRYRSWPAWTIPSGSTLRLAFDIAKKDLLHGSESGPALQQAKMQQCHQSDKLRYFGT